MSTYSLQLTQAQRYQIWSLRETKHNLREIGCKVGVHYSTFSRELRRNKSLNGYEASAAHNQSISRKKAATKDNTTKSVIKPMILLEKDLLWAGLQNRSVNV